MFDSYIYEITCEEIYSEDTENLWAEVMEEEEAYASSLFKMNVQPILHYINLTKVTTYSIIKSRGERNEGQYLQEA